MRELQAYIHKYHLEHLRRRAESGTMEPSETGFLFPGQHPEASSLAYNSDSYRSTMPSELEISSDLVNNILSDSEDQASPTHITSDWPEGIPQTPALDTPAPNLTSNMAQIPAIIKTMPWPTTAA